MSEKVTKVGSNIAEAVSSPRLGKRVRELRRGRGLTLEALAERSGVSRAMISKIERGEKNPTLVVAARLAEGFGVTLSQLAGVEERRKVIVIPKEKQMVMRDPETDFERRLLSPEVGRHGIEFSRNVIPESSTSGEFPAHREGVEGYVVVEQGRLKTILGGEEYFLQKRDAMYFEADVAHRFENAGEGECSYYLVVARVRER